MASSHEVDCALTSNKEAQLCEVQPAMAWDHLIPCTLNRQTLYDDRDARECRHECCYPNEEPDGPDLDLVSHDSKQENRNGAFAEPDGGHTSDLTENLPFNGREIGHGITHIRKMHPKTISRCCMDQRRVDNMNDLRQTLSVRHTDNLALSSGDPYQGND